MSQKTVLGESGAEQVVWDLSDLYESPDDPRLIRDRKSLMEEAEAFAGSYRGSVADLSPEDFLEALRRYEQLIITARKIGSYAHLIWSTNTEDPALGKLVQEATELASEVNQKLVFFDVEWLAIDEERARKWIENDALSPFRHYLETSRLFRDHTLNEGQEQVVSAKNVTGRSAWVRYFDETMGSTRFELDGEELTQQQLLSKLHSTDRALRKRAQVCMTDKLSELRRTLTFIFNTVLADKAASDKMRNYEHWIDSRNLSNQISRESVDALVESVTGSYPMVQRYYRLKRELLGLEELCDYDRYAPITESEKRISWEEAKEIVLTSFGAFHPDMEKIASRFFEEGWIDAAIRPGKRGGAFSASTVTTVHPYILLNYDGRLRDVQTLAHELGHGVHQFLSRKQGELQSSTPLTTAETASVFAEMLVFEALMGRLDDPKEKLALLVSKIDDTIATVFRQISMNRFEDAVHRARRTDGELTTEDFSRYWMDTQHTLYGDAVSLTEEYKIWWSYIPHFLHTPGYVYAYAFGELLVLSLYDSYRDTVEDGREGTFADRYMKLLEAGGSDWPDKLVSRLDQDISNPSFWSGGLTIFGQMVQQAEELSNQIDRST